jgi:hypothetical protein
VLFQLDHALDERGQCLVFAEMKDPVRRKIDGYGLTAKIEPRHLFPTVEAAVAEFRAQTSAEWRSTPAVAGAERGRPDVL